MQQTKKFGAFLGVFTPSVLTILGVIMYLRFGWVVANAGLIGTLAIVVICCSIALITGLSASAVATNSKLGAGGEYYMISRSLGLTIGGAIGIPLFLCYILSITLYCFGLAETITFFWPAKWGAPPIQSVTAFLILMVVAIAGKSARAALKLQIPLMFCVGLSLVALAIGVLTGPFKNPQWFLPAESAGEGVGFWVILAVFFPAVTGFSAGIGMSGDLEDPQKDIPKGTIMAVLVGAAVYLIIPFLLAITGRVSTEQLASIDPQQQPIWTKIAFLGPWLIYPGICGAILSSAFGSALAGPRVLQALANDGLVPAFLGKVNKTDQPVIATWFAGAIALGAVAMGDLNTVAKLVTILFLTLYMIENLVATIENIVKDPSYRPTLKIHWAISLLGVIGIIIVMLLISPTMSIIALALEACVWLYLRRKNFVATWGNVWSGIWGSWARLAIYNLTQQTETARSWRPNILLFADNLRERLGQVRLSAWFNQNSGILTVCEMMTGDIEKDFEEAQQKEEDMAKFLQAERIVAFNEVDVVEDFESGVLSVMQANGSGTLRSNTIAFGWPRRQEKLISLLKIIRKIVHTGKAAIIINSNPPKGPENFDRIDIWWRGKNNNGDLMLMLAYLLTLGPRWRNATIYIRSIATTDFTKKDIEESLENLIDVVRINAKQDVITLPEGTSVIDLMHETSKGADIVFMGMMTAEPDKEEEYAQRLTNIIEDLPTTVLVRNSGPFQGQLL
jgi:amino acid transporter